MQDGNSIFIENYQSEDLGASIHRSKSSLHLPDSFRLKIQPQKPLRNSEKHFFFFSNAKRPTRADTSAVETGILSLMELWAVKGDIFALDWDFCTLSTCEYATIVGPWLDFFMLWFNVIAFGTFTTCDLSYTALVGLKILAVRKDQSESATLHLGPWLEFLWAV